MEHSCYMLLRRIWYAGIVPERDRVRIFFYPWTITLCQYAIDSAKTEIPNETRHYDNKWGDGIDFLIEPDEWKTHKEKLTALVQSLYEAWQDGEQ